MHQRSGRFRSGSIDPPMADQGDSLAPNIVKSSCAAGTVEHAWLPRCSEGGYISRAAPSGICLTFSRHLGCVVVIGGKRLQRDVERGCVQIAGPQPIDWHVVREPSDVVEVTATPSVRAAIAAEMQITEAADLDDLHGGTDRVIWAIAARLRTGLRTRTEPACLEYEQLIWELYRQVFATRFGGRISAKGNGKLDQRRLERVAAFIDAHLTDSGLSIATLAEVASLSPFHFLRTFERTFHMTPHHYVRARRLEAVRAASAGGEALLEAARRYGFGHLRHFCSAYCRHHGLSPSEH